MHRFTTLLISLLVIFHLGVSLALAMNELEAKNELDRKGYRFTAREFVRAAEKGDEKIVRLFLEAGMDPNSLDNPRNSDSALNKAIYRKKTKIVRLLLEHGADVNLYASGDTPLGLACYRGRDEEIIDLLLAAGADPSGPPGPNRRCRSYPLYGAIVDRDMELFQRLLDGGARIDQNNEHCLLIEAARGGEKEMLLELIDRGADPTANDTGHTPLMAAASRGKKEVVQILIDHGADIHALDRNYRSVIGWAQWGENRRKRGAKSVVKLLQELGCVKVDGLFKDNSVDKYIDYINKGWYYQGLVLMREEINGSNSGRWPSYGIMATHTLMCMVHVGSSRGFTPALDLEAEKYYGIAIVNPRFTAPDHEIDWATQAAVHQVMGSYYGLRNSQATLDCIEKSLAICHEHSLSFTTIMNLANLSVFYESLGQERFAEKYWTEMQQLAKTYFVLGVSPEDESQWANYLAVLQVRWVNARGPDRVRRVQDSWRIAQPAIEKYSNNKFPYYNSICTALARVGEFAAMEALIPTMEKYAKKEKDKKEKIGSLTFTEYDQQMTRGTIALYRGEADQALPLLTGCLEMQTESEFDFDGGLHRMIARCWELKGDYASALEYLTEAVGMVEEYRDMLPVDQRLRLLSHGGWRDWYAGLARLHARRYLEYSAPAEFGNVIASADLLHGRQLRELIDPRDPAAAGRLSLTDIRVRLGEDRVLLLFTSVSPSTDTDDTYLCLAVSADDEELVLVPYDADRLQKRIARIRDRLETPDGGSTELYRELLALSDQFLGPLSRHLEGKSELVVMSGGVLGLIPFELLSTTEDTYRPVIDSKSVRVIPSVKQFLAMNKEAPSQSTGFLGVADANYTGRENEAGSALSPMREFDRHTKPQTLFPPIPETRNETIEIGDLFPSQDRQVLFGANATESNLKTSVLAKYRFIHIAAHGILENEIPGILEPGLILSEEPGEDGILLASEAETLNLDADLTVLSACNTGSGEYVSGEGALGLSRAFLVAGSRAVLVSLWQVDSQTTEFLMVDFYRRLNDGASMPEALRQAKIALRRDFRLDGRVARNERGLRPVRPFSGQDRSEDGLHPFFWAPFVLINP